MAKILPDILGRWRIIEMEGCDPNDANREVRAFIQFDRDGGGEFEFGLVHGFIDHRLLERERKPGVEWTWEGNDEMDGVSGRGWAVLHHDRLLRGMFFIHQGDETDFVAKKVGAKKPGAFSNVRSSKATARQGQFLALGSCQVAARIAPVPLRPGTDTVDSPARQAEQAVSLKVVPSGGVTGVKDYR
jgi:hypothetical protein